MSDAQIPDGLLHSPTGYEAPAESQPEPQPAPFDQWQQQEQPYEGEPEPVEDDVPRDVPKLADLPAPDPFPLTPSVELGEVAPAAATVVNVAAPSKEATARGLATSEFLLTSLLTIVTLVCSTVLLALDKIESGLWVAALAGGAGLPSAAYALSRGLTKLGTGTTAAPPPVD